ncbi:guanidinobutyrase-like isoform X2 [Eriocheir sinensis]|uniref:guanidinobutyrase-like isoform X2 n=1 Tax=Eriocheir sinensis TaxID=95602 RepID=UPI0021CA9280|nr:guanidinobutyrase-like isoform X2 [Eriocheir sinensis]
MLHLILLPALYLTALSSMFGIVGTSGRCLGRGLGASWRGLHVIRQHTSLFLRTMQDTRHLHTTSPTAKKLNQPLAANQMPRAGGISSFMRLPIQTNTTGLDACFVGVPLDTGCSNRAGARYGPRGLRCESPLRPVNQGTGVNPFLTHNVADIGDVWLNLYNLEEACSNIREQYSAIISNGCVPLTMGGDHTISYPILQAMKDKYGPVGLIHVDAHPDLQDSVLGSKICHGTPFKRAYDEQILDASRVVQIGLRGTGYSSDDCNIGRSMGFRVVGAQECWYKSLEPLMAEVRQQIGEGPVYLSFDIDAIDPSFCPGTGVATLRRSGNNGSYGCPSPLRDAVCAARNPTTRLITHKAPSSKSTKSSLDMSSVL